MVMKDSILIQTRLYMLLIILLMEICDLLQLHSVTRKTSSLLGDMGSGKRLNDVIPIHHHIPKKMPAYYDVTCIHLESIFFSRACISRSFVSHNLSSTSPSLITFIINHHFSLLIPVQKF